MPTPTRTAKSGITRRLVSRTAPKAPDTPWARFCAALTQQGERFAVITKAVHLEEERRLRLILPAGRPLAEAERLLKMRLGACE